MEKKLFSQVLPAQDQNEMKKRAFQEIVEIAVESGVDIVSDYGNENKHEVGAKLFSKVAPAIGETAEGERSRYGMASVGAEPEESIARNYGYDNVEDMKVNYFDSKEEKERKERIWAGLTEGERQELEEEWEEMREHDSTEPEKVEFAEILENMPSIFDGKEEYTRKREALLKQFPQMEGQILEAEKIHFPKAVRTRRSSSRFDKQLEKAAPKTFLQNIISAEKPAFRNGDFWYEEGELKYQDTKMEEAVVIGNFWIEIKKEVIRVTEICNEQNLITNYKETTTWQVCIFCMGKTFEVEAKVKGLLSDAEILKITKDRAYLEQVRDSRRLYKKYINALIVSSNYEREYLFNNTGWVYLKEKGWVYLTREGIIGDSESNIRADVPYSFLYRKENVGSKQVFEQFWGLRRLCNKNGKMANSVFLMHYSCVSVMTTLFQDAGKGVNFVVALIGSTNSQKTAVGLIFTRLFDRTPASSPDIRFNSTEVAIMEKMGLYGDAIMMVDDFVPYAAKNLASEQRKKSETIIRSYGDREPRKRSKTYAKINDVPEYSPVKGCCLITGEIFQTESESSDTRVIQLQFERGDVNLELLTFYQENLWNFSTFFYDFICFIQQNVTQIQKIMCEKLKETRGQQTHQNISTPRFIDSLAIMAAGAEIFYDYACSRGFMKADEAQKFLEEDMEMIEKIIAKNDCDSKTKSPATLISLALKRGIETGMVSFYTMEEMAKCENYLNVVAEDEDYLYILPEALWQLYKEFCKNIGEEIIYKSGRDLHAPMKKENLLQIKAEGKNNQQRATHKIGNFTSKRFFIIKKLEMKKLLEIYEKF